jgi:cobalt/nickel transport protein
MNTYKKYLIFLGILAILSPLGIIVPQYFNAGEAWGEWSIGKIKELTGFEPKGMKKDALLYTAPISSYSIRKNNSTMLAKSGDYVLSGIIGISIILILTFLWYYRINKKVKKNDSVIS